MSIASLGDRRWVWSLGKQSEDFFQLSFVTSVYTCCYAFATGQTLIAENRVSNWLYLNIIIVCLLGSLRN